MKLKDIVIGGEYAKTRRTDIFSYASADLVIPLGTRWIDPRATLQVTRKQPYRDEENGKLVLILERVSFGAAPVEEAKRFTEADADRYYRAVEASQHSADQRLPSGWYVRVVQPSAIKMTWAEYEAGLAERNRERAEAEAAQEKTKAADRIVRERIAVTLEERGIEVRRDQFGGHAPQGIRDGKVTLTYEQFYQLIGGKS